MHESVTLDRVLAMVEDTMMDTACPGICVACGQDADGCEPDARNYKCECCGKRQVFGAEELMLEMA